MLIWADENSVTSTDVFAQVATVTSRQAEPLTCIKPYLKFDLQQVRGSLLSDSTENHYLHPATFSMKQKFSVFMLMQLVSKTNQKSAFGSITLHLIKLKMIKNDQLVGSLLKCYHGTCPTLLHWKTFTPLYSGMILWFIQIVVLLVNIFLMRLNCTLLKDLMLSMFVLMWQSCGLRWTVSGP